MIEESEEVSSTKMLASHMILESLSGHFNPPEYAMTGT